MLGCFSERSKNNKYITKIVLTDMSTDTCYKCSLTVNGTDDTVTAQLTVRNTSCIASLEKKIVIRPSKKNSPILNEEFAVYTEIDCKLYPNPNNGNFILDFQTNNEFLFGKKLIILTTGNLLKSTFSKSKKFNFFISIFFVLNFF